MIYQAVAGALFCASLLAGLYTFAGYPLLLALLVRNRRAHSGSTETEFPSACVVVVAYNEEARIQNRLRNLLESDYPADKLTVVLVCDGSSDQTARAAAEVDPKRIQVLEQAERNGKAAGLNIGVAAANAEIIVFADARQSFAPNTIRRLVSHFSDPAAGAVSGSLAIEAATSGLGKAVGRYWSLEKSIREWESRLDSCIGCTGAVYAIRKRLFTPIPNDTVLDDVVIPMLVASAGFRVLHDPEAFAFDPQPLDPVHERRRKRRTLAGNFQMLFRYPQWLWPSRNRLCWQLISHKYLRLAMPLFLAGVFVSNLFLAANPLFALLLLGQILFYGLAILGTVRPELRHRAIALPAGFLFLNWCIMEALWRYLQEQDLHRWTPATQPQR